MSPLARNSSAAGLVAGVGFALLALSRSGDMPTAVVTTDTRQYCSQLLERVTALIRAAPDPLPYQAHWLANDGRDLCERGEVRDGVLRLRRALALVTYGRDRPEDGRSQVVP